MESSRVYQARMRFARHYVESVCRGCEAYISGFEASLGAIALFNQDRVQIEQTAAWLMQSLNDDDEAARLFVRLMKDGYPLLYACLLNTELLTWVETALPTAARLGDIVAQGSHLYALGWSAFQAQNFDKAIALFEQALDFARRTPNEFLQSAILGGLGQAYTRIGNFDTARGFFSEMYELRLRLNDVLGIHLYLFEQASMLFNEGLADEALPVFEQAYEYALKAGGYREISRVLTNIGLLYNSQGRYHEALQLYQQALEFAQCIHFPPVVVYVLHSIANTYVVLEDFNAARDYFLDALQVAQTNRLQNAADIQADLGNLAYMQGKFNEALAYLHEALEHHRSVQADYNLIVDLGYLTLVYTALGDFPTAKQTLLENIEITKRVSVEIWTLLLINIAIQYNISRAFNTKISAPEVTCLLEGVSQWSGFLLAHPGTERDKIALITQLRSKIEAQLGSAYAAELFDQGKLLTLPEVLAAIEALS